MRGETALTRRPVTHPRRLSAGKPQWLPGGAKGCAPRDSNPNLLIRRQVVATWHDTSSIVV